MWHCQNILSVPLQQGDDSFVRRNPTRNQPEIQTRTRHLVIWITILHSFNKLGRHVRVHLHVRHRSLIASSTSLILPTTELVTERTTIMPKGELSVRVVLSAALLFLTDGLASATEVTTVPMNDLSTSLPVGDGSVSTIIRDPGGVTVTVHTTLVRSQSSSTCQTPIRCRHGLAVHLERSVDLH